MWLAFVSLCRRNAAANARPSAIQVYDFKRLPLPDLLDKLDLGPSANTIEYSGWYHPYFLRDDHSRLSLMTPRPSRARAQKKQDKADRLDAQRRKSFGPG